MHEGLLLVLIIVVRLGYVRSQTGVKGYDEECMWDTECTDYMVCKGNDKGSSSCTCEEGFTVKKNKACGKAVDTWCWYQSECADNLECNKGHVCVCKANFHVKEDGSCGRPTGGSCTLVSDCGDHMVCASNRTCVCDQAHTVTPIGTCETQCNISDSNCEPGGECYTTGVPPSHTCICHSGYTGATCQVPTATYDVYITTGSSDHAGNDYIVYLEMSGSNGSTGRLSLNSAIGTNNPFEKGRLDRFSFEIVDVGGITSVTVSYQDRRGPDDRWFIERVDIKRSEPPSEAVHTFVFYVWLDNHQFYTLTDPCVTPSCENDTMCRHVASTSHNYTCTCDASSSLPRCNTDSKCEYQQAKYQTEGNSVSEFECSHTQHCQDPAHAAIITSTQELNDVTRCVCQGDVSGFFARLMIDNDTELTPASDENCEDTPSCEFQNTRICIRNEKWSRVNCRTRCGYCANGWMRLEDTEHMFKFVHESDVNVTECEARCDAHSVRVVEVGCFGANQYEKHVLCETGEDDSHLLECPVTTTALGVDTTTDSARTTPDRPTASGLTSEALESPTVGTIAAEATRETTAAVTSTTSQPATTTTDATTSEPVTTTQTTTSTDPTTTSSSDAATTTSHNPTTTTVETTTTSTTTWKSTAAETPPESAHQTTTAEVSSSDRDACRAMCDSFSTKNTPESTIDADTARSTSKAATSEIPGFWKTRERSTGTSSLDKTPTDATNSTTKTTKKSNWYTALCNITSPEQPENMTRAEFLEVLAEQVRKELTVNVSSLSKTRAKKISAPDHRKSSQTAGYMAVGFLVTFFVLMMLLDLNRVYDGLRGRQEVGTQDLPEAHEVGSEKAPLPELSSP